jgi:hypothetical protein
MDRSRLLNVRHPGSGHDDTAHGQYHTSSSSFCLTYSIQCHWALTVAHAHATIWSFKAFINPYRQLERRIHKIQSDQSKLALDSQGTEGIPYATYQILALDYAVARISCRGIGCRWCHNRPRDCSLSIYLLLLWGAPLAHENGAELSFFQGAVFVHGCQHFILVASLRTQVAGWAYEHVLFGISHISS